MLKTQICVTRPPCVNLRALHHGVPSLLREAERCLQLAAASYIYIYYALKEKRKERLWWQRVHKEGSVQRFEFAGRLECSVGQWVV